MLFPTPVLFSMRSACPLGPKASVGSIQPMIEIPLPTEHGDLLIKGRPIFRQIHHIHKRVGHGGWAR